MLFSHGSASKSSSKGRYRVRGRRQRNGYSKSRRSSNGYHPPWTIPNFLLVASVFHCLHMSDDICRAHGISDVRWALDGISKNSVNPVLADTFSMAGEKYTVASSFRKIGACTVQRRGRGCPKCACDSSIAAAELVTLGAPTCRTRSCSHSVSRCTSSSLRRLEKKSFFNRNGKR